MQAGDFRALAVTKEEAHTLSVETGEAMVASLADLSMNLLTIAAGRTAEALAFLEDRRRGGRSVAEGVLHLGQQAWIAEIGEDAAAYDRLMADLEPDLTAYWTSFPLWKLRCRVLTDDNEASKMLGVWGREVRPEVPSIRSSAVDAATCRLLADVAEPEVAARAYAEMLPWVATWPFFGPGRLYGVGDHLLGLAARAGRRLDDSVDHLRRGLELHETSKLPLFIAESHIELARTLVARNAPGDKVAARPHLDQAGSIAAERGFRRVERLVKEVRSVTC
ncbi:MAG: hypothetical protein NVS3B1_30140 [Marmoricola sp.]